MQPIPEASNHGASKYDPNSVIQDYQLLKRLGGSDISATFQAINKKTEEFVVIKIFSKLLPLAVTLYETEIKAFEKLHNMHGVLNLKAVGETEEAFFIVTESIKEGSIRNIFNKFPKGMELDEALDLFTPIADVIDRIHGENIIHRDLKPENILFRKIEHGYEIFITDFGLVKFTNDSKLFQTETTAGTPLYIAPEAWNPDQTVSKSKAVDLYSLGVMLYEALEGKVPFDNPADVIQVDPPLPERTRQNSNDEVVRQLLKALSKQPEERPSSAGALIDGIRNGYYNTLENADQKWIGQRIRNYTINEILGRGKMGITMRAKDNRGKDFVLKMFETSIMAGNPKQLFDKEMKSFQKLEAEHGVLLPCESFAQKGNFYIVFDYQPGGNLRKFLNDSRKRMDLTNILDVFSQIAEAIDYTHSKKIIHRDLKPENVVYRKEGERIITFLTDFGIAEILEGTKSSFYTKTAAGTFYYMAPEAWNPKARKTRAMDIYSFGVMLYEALEGHVPFTSEYPAIMFQHTNEPVPDPTNTARKLGLDAKRFLLETLAKNPEERPKTAKEIVDKLRGKRPEYFGRKYGKYMIESLIGQSAIGATYKAIDTTNKKRKVALKILPISEPINNEIEILKKLERHNGILPILDSGQDGGVHYLVTEYMSGGNLREYLQSYPEGMDFEEAMHVYEPISEALDYLHTKGVVHRDLKPENIVLRRIKQNGTSTLEPFITDFGISKLLEKTPSLNTRTSVLAGTYKYIAPEVWDDQEPSPANDIYALGIMLYETLEGSPPFNARTPASIMKQHINDVPPRPTNLATGRGEAAAKALLKSLEKQPELRQTTARELVKEIEEAERLPTFTGPLSNPLGTFFDLVKKARRYVILGVGLPLMVSIVFWLTTNPSILSVLGGQTPSATLTSTIQTISSFTSTPTETITSTPTRMLNFTMTVTSTQTATPAKTVRFPYTPTRTKSAPGSTNQPVHTIVPATNTPVTQATVTNQPIPTQAPTAIPGKAQCNDGIDNDEDGLTDWSNQGGDPQCQNKQDDDESR